MRRTKKILHIYFFQNFYLFIFYPNQTGKRSLLFFLEFPKVSVCYYNNKKVVWMKKKIITWSRDSIKTWSPDVR